MVLEITLILVTLCGLAYGLVKKNRKIIIVSVVGLVLIAVLYGIYSYLYSLNPY